MLIIGIILCLAFVSVIGLGAFVALFDEGRGLNGIGGGIVFLFFVVMAFFLWSSLNDFSEYDSVLDQPLSYIEDISKKENLAESNPPLAVSPNKDNASEVETVAINEPVYELELVKKLYITFMAFLPAVLYLFFIYLSDHLKPEPVPVLLFAVFIGTVLAVVGKFLGFTLYDSGLSLINNVPMSLNIGFIRIAIPTEVAKWLLLLAFLSFNKYYDEYFDGIVYSVCVSMGLACVLSVGYMIHLMGSLNFVFYIQGLVTFLVMIPLNVIAGTIMGYFIALSKHKNKFQNYFLSLVLPVLTSGVLYSIVAYLDDVLWHYLIFVLILTPLSVLVYRQMWHLMKLDAKQLQEK